jgi:hypothetical protein
MVTPISARGAGPRSGGTITCLVALAAGLAVAAVAPAGARAEARAERDVGITFGGGLSITRVGCERQMCFTARTAGVVDGHFGVIVAPRVAIFAEGWGSSYEEGESTVTRAMLGVGVRLWAMPRLWLSAAAGVSSTRVSPNLEMVEFNEIVGVAPAASVGVGFEAVSTESFAVDLHARSGVTLVDDRPTASSMTVGLGASWY